MVIFYSYSAMLVYQAGYLSLVLKQSARTVEPMKNSSWPSLQRSANVSPQACERPMHHFRRLEQLRSTLKIGTFMIIYGTFWIVYGTFFAVFWRPLPFLLLRAEVFRMDVAAIYRGGFGHPSTWQSRWAQFRVTHRHHKRGKMGKDGAAIQFAVKNVKNGRPHFECQLCQLQICLTLFWYPVAIPEDFDRTPGVAWGPRRSTLLLCCSSNLPSDGSCRQGWFIVTTHGTAVQKCCAIRDEGVNWAK